ncbi:MULTISPECIES: RraA family protein [Vibrio]|uniref:Putative 4-hydroxy-4-methyl-2-oxoglutarate aldolase n=1 Tax=Vibrio ostreae TaxID=2841925 RepID=A0A975U7V5_9VIBR|nr:MULTISPECIES: RraA family protein [Vibrio]QXO16610.1 RraA family protein [Vibrio ostreae]
MSVGFKINARERTASQELLQAYKDLPVANVSDSMNRLFAGGPTLRPMHTSGQMLGSAITVKSRPGDNLMLHKAIDMAVPGDVIVVDGGGEIANALMGELMLAHAINKGVVGFVINGAIRDLDAFRETNLPTFAAGVTHRGPFKDGPGEINVPVSIDGMVIHPGDIMIGDSDGVLAVPLDDAQWILESTLEKQDKEVKQMAAIKQGLNDRTWVDKALLSKGCAGL